MKIGGDFRKVGVVNTSDAVAARHKPNHFGNVETVLCEGGRMGLEILLRLWNTTRASLSGINTSAPERDLDSPFRAPDKGQLNSTELAQRAIFHILTLAPSPERHGL